MWAFGSPRLTSASPILGVDTVKRSNVRSPGVMPPSSTLQKLAGRSSTRTTQCCLSAAWSTIRSGLPVGKAFALALLVEEAFWAVICGNTSAVITRQTTANNVEIRFFKAESSLTDFEIKCEAPCSALLLAQLGSSVPGLCCEAY